MEWDKNESLKQLGGSSIKNPITCIAGQTINGENIILDIGNNILFKIKKSGEGIVIYGEDEIELIKTK